MDKTDRFFDALMRWTVVCGGAVYLGEVCAKYLAPHLPQAEPWLRGISIALWVSLAVWSLWPRKAKSVQQTPSGPSRPRNIAKR